MNVSEIAREEEKPVKKRIHPRGVSVMPNTHFVMILTTFVITIVFGIMYFFAPPGKEGMFYSVVLLSVGALFGKLSNQFGKAVKPFPISMPAIVDTDGDGIADDEENQDATQ